MPTPLRVATVSCALSLVVLPAAAQTVAARPVAPPPAIDRPSDDASVCPAPGDLLHAERARALYEEGLALMEVRSDWGRAAFRFERAAQASPPCDARAVDAWMMAARLYHHAGKPEASRLAFLGAADRGRAAGELARAAHALLDAAVIAVDQGDQEAARQAVLEADELSRSPRIPVRERLTIRSRIVDLRTRPGLAGDRAGRSRRAGRS